MTDQRSSRLLKGVIFDMDGVLLASEPLLAQAAIRLFGEKGVTVVHEDFHPFIGMGEDRYIGGVAEAKGVKLDPPRDKARLYEIYLELIKGRLGPLPGVREFVHRCRERDLAIAVASSADRIKVEGNLREIGLPVSTFDVVIDGTEVARKKPAPDLFLAACRCLNLPPAHCLVIEDAVAGVAAAKAAGARCLAVTTTFSADQLTAADWIAPNLAQAPAGVLNW